jgi:hypothetical protein
LRLWVFVTVLTVAPALFAAWVAALVAALVAARISALWPAGSQKARDQHGDAAERKRQHQGHDKKAQHG